MKRLLYLVILSTAAMLISVPAASAQDEMTVSIQDFFFDPDQLNVAPATTVTWVNEGEAPHTVTSTDGKELDSATLQPGDTYSFTFHMLRHTFAPIKELLAGTQSDQNRRA